MCIRDRKEVSKVIQSKYKGVKLKKDNGASRKSRAKQYDGSIYKNDKLSGFFEIKVRPYMTGHDPFTVQALRKGDTHGNKGYMISSWKIEVLRKKAKKHRVPTFIFVMMPSEKKIMVVPVTDGAGKELIVYNIKKTKTFSSCNRKKIVARDNAYIDVDKSNCKYIDYSLSDLSSNGAVNHKNILDKDFH